MVGVDDLQHPALGEVGVLVLVEEDRRVLGPQGVGDLRMIGEEPHGQGDLVAKVEQPALALAPGVCGHHLAQLAPHGRGVADLLGRGAGDDSLAVLDQRLDRNQVVGAP